MRRACLFVSFATTIVLVVGCAPKAYEIGEILTYFKRCGFAFTELDNGSFRELGARDGVSARLKHERTSIRLLEFNDADDLRQAARKLGQKPDLLTKNNLLLELDSRNEHTKSSLAKAFRAYGSPQETPVAKTLKRPREELQAATAATTGYLASLTATDFRKAYRFLSRKTKEALTREDYVSGKKQTSPSDKSSLEITDASIDNAGSVTVRIRGPEDEYIYKVVSERGGWRLQLNEEALADLLPLKVVLVDEPLAMPEDAVLTAGAPWKTSFISNIFGTVHAEGIFVVVTLMIENGTNDAYAPTMFELVDDNDRVFEELETSYMYLDNYIDDAEVGPGSTGTGDIVFDVPVDATGLKLKVYSFSGGLKRFGLVDLGV